MMLQPSRDDRAGTSARHFRKKLLWPRKSGQLLEGATVVLGETRKKDGELGDDVRALHAKMGGADARERFLFRPLGAEVGLLPSAGK